MREISEQRGSKPFKIEEAPTLAREREPLYHDRMRNLRSHLPKREPRANCRKTKPSSGLDHAAGIRNSFDFAARLVFGGRTVHPASRVFRSAFHGFTR